MVSASGKKELVTDTKLFIDVACLVGREHRSPAAWTSLSELLRAKVLSLLDVHLDGTNM